MPDGEIQPGSIAYLFADLKTQLNQVSADIRALRVDNQRQFEALETKYASQGALEAEARLLNARQSGYEDQTDLKLLAYDQELQYIRKEIESAAEDRQNTRRVAWSAVAGVVSTVLSAVVITLLNVHG